MKRILLLGVLAASAVVFSAFTETKTEVIKEVKSSIEAPVMKIVVPEGISIFNPISQAIIKQQLTGSIPCSYGACVCDNWREIQPGNPNSGFARTCGCYGEINNFWHEFKSCAYCVPTPNYGSQCQNG